MVFPMSNLYIPVSFESVSFYIKKKPLMSPCIAAESPSSIIIDHYRVVHYQGMYNFIIGILSTLYSCKRDGRLWFVNVEPLYKNREALSVFSKRMILKGRTHREYRRKLSSK